MNSKRYVVDLTEEERRALLGLLKKGKASARKIARAQILLSADRADTDEAIARALHVSVRTVQRTRQRFSESRLEGALKERPRPGAQRKLDGKAEAFLVALTCSDPPEGQKRWTMQLLANKLVELKVVEEPISDETIRLVLKKGRSNRG
jgi:transposase